VVTTTVPPTTAPSTTIGSVSQPAVVLGTSVTAPATTAAPPTTVKTAVLGETAQRSLPVTGTNTRDLLLLGGVAMLLGGLALVAADKLPKGARRKS
jgi:LPXTG-motif cell wall-anchored protein